MSIESRAKGHEGAQSIAIEKIELNPASIDAALFHMPEVKKPAEETKKQ
jgi:hypothetical protein